MEGSGCGLIVVLFQFLYGWSKETTHNVIRCGCEILLSDGVLK